MKSIKSWSLIWWKGTQNIYKFFLRLVWGCNVHILFAPIFLQVDTLSLLFMFYSFNLFPKGVPFLFIVSPNASEPSTYTYQGRNWVACPIKTLLEVGESVMSCETIVLVSFLHKCSQFSWCSALNVEVRTSFLRYFISSLLVCLWSFPWCPILWCKWPTEAFPRCIPPRAPRTMGPLVPPPQTFVHMFSLN